MAWNNDNKSFESYDPKFANWNKWYDDLFQEQKDIRRIGVMLMGDYNNKQYSLQLYYSRIVGLFSTHKHYIDKSDDVNNELDKIEAFLFSEKYLAAKESNPKSVRQSELKILKQLRNVFTKMCEDFSSKGLSVKVDITNKAKASDLEDDEDKKQELEDLEESGMI